MDAHGHKFWTVVSQTELITLQSTCVVER